MNQKIKVNGLIVIVVLLLVFTKLSAQDENKSQLFLKTGIGAVAGTFKYNDTDDQSGSEYSKGTLKGYGLSFDLHAGIRIKKKNVIALSFNLSEIPISKFSQEDSYFDSGYKLRINGFNPGLTYSFYFLPSNIYISAGWAYSIMGLTREGDPQKSSYGMSGVAEFGKTWQIGKGNWSFGVNINYRYIRTTTTYKESTEIITSQPISIGVVTTFH